MIKKIKMKARKPTMKAANCFVLHTKQVCFPYTFVIYYEESYCFTKNLFTSIQEETRRRRFAGALDINFQDYNVIDNFLRNYKSL